MIDEDEAREREEEQGGMALASCLFVAAWVAAGGLVAWLCSWIFPLYVRGQNISFWVVCAIYFVLSVIVAVIINRWGNRRYQKGMKIPIDKKE